MKKIKFLSFFALFFVISNSAVFGAGVPLSSTVTTELLSNYVSQGPFLPDQKKCILGSFKIFHYLKGDAKAANESEFEQWKTACKKMAACKHAISMKPDLSVTIKDDFDMYDCIPEECTPEYHDKQRGGCFEDKEYTNQIKAKIKAAEAAEKEQKRRDSQNEKLAKQCPRGTRLNTETQKCDSYEPQFKDNDFYSVPIKNFWLITKTDNVAEIR